MTSKKTIKKDKPAAAPSSKPGPKKTYHLPDDVVQIAEIVARAMAPTYEITGEEAIKGAVRLAGEAVAAKMAREGITNDGEQ